MIFWVLRKCISFDRIFMYSNRNQNFQLLFIKSYSYKAYQNGVCVCVCNIEKIENRISNKFETTGSNCSIVHGNISAFSFDDVENISVGNWHEYIVYTFDCFIAQQFHNIYISIFLFFFEFILICVNSNCVH